MSVLIPIIQLIPYQVQGRLAQSGIQTSSSTRGNKVYTLPIQRAWWRLMTTASTHHANLIPNRLSDPRTAEQAFFAIGRCMAIDTMSFLDSPQMILTPSGLVFLAKVGLLPRFTRKDVTIKSQSNAFAKLISCTQALWFLLQGIGRVCTGLPLTLLEIHTMTHIICALVIYGIWSKKPTS